MPNHTRRCSKLRLYLLSCAGFLTLMQMRFMMRMIMMTVMKMMMTNMAMTPTVTTWQ